MVRNSVTADFNAFTPRCIKSQAVIFRRGNYPENNLPWPNFGFAYPASGSLGESGKIHDHSCDLRFRDRKMNARKQSARSFPIKTSVDPFFNFQHRGSVQKRLHSLVATGHLHFAKSSTRPLASPRSSIAVTVHRATTRAANSISVTERSSDRIAGSRVRGALIARHCVQ